MTRSQANQMGLTGLFDAVQSTGRKEDITREEKRKRKGERESAPVMKLSTIQRVCSFFLLCLPAGGTRTRGGGKKKKKKKRKKGKEEKVGQNLLVPTTNTLQVLFHYYNAGCKGRGRSKKKKKGEREEGTPR